MNKGKGCKLCWLWERNAKALIDFLSCNELKTINPEQTTAVVPQCTLRYIWSTPCCKFCDDGITTTVKTCMKLANWKHMCRENKIYAWHIDMFLIIQILNTHVGGRKTILNVFFKFSTAEHFSEWHIEGPPAKQSLHSLDFIRKQ